MIGTSGHTSLVLNELGTVSGARIAAWAFEDADWKFNTDGSRRNGGDYDLEFRRRWIASGSWSEPTTTAYETYQEMLEHETLDLAVICLPYARKCVCPRSVTGPSGPCTNLVARRLQHW